MGVRWRYIISQAPAPFGNSSRISRLHFFRLRIGLTLDGRSRGVL